MHDDEPKNTPMKQSLHPPQSDPKTKKITLWIVIGIAAVALVYVLLYSDVFKKDKSQSEVVIPEEVPRPPDTLSQAYSDTQMTSENTMPVNEEPAPASNNIEKPKETKKETAATPRKAGWFTVYVGSFKNKSLAEKEKARFTENNYQAFIIPHEGMFRVAVGQFATRDEAKEIMSEIASEMKKEGWIDRIE